jgi:hypothetical protein
MELENCRREVNELRKVMRILYNNDIKRKHFLENMRILYILMLGRARSREKTWPTSLRFFAGEINFSLPFLFIELPKWRCRIGVIL